MHHHLFKILKTTPLSKALNELKNKGIHDHYLLKDQHDTFIGGFFSTPPKDLVYSQGQATCATVNWEDQAKLHSPYYSEGLISIPLQDFGFPSLKHVKLHPGAGFGDLSHPTTCLMLNAMSQHLTEKSHVLDIGSGSGILTLAAHIGLGCNVLGLEIDPQALELSKKNALLNTLDVSFLTHLPEGTLHSFSVILLNMIFSEQQEVFKAYPFKDYKGMMIISGILNSQKESYLQSLSSFNYSLINSIELDQWICFIIKI